MDPVDDDPRSVEERAGNGEHDEPDELFPSGSLPGDGMSPQRLVKKGMPTKVEVSIGKAAVPVTDGLLDPERSGRVLVSYAYEKTEEVPEFEGKGPARRIVGWTIRQHLRSVYVEQANDEASLIRSEFEALVALDEGTAGRLLDDLRALFAETARQVA